ncbi:hypothetical protein E3N88_16596 [Mikania micrantha]|uniref:Uncharacterized protein n=1 Tax=Mikania micrantha TaxID=192012 RepID=A0A5N6P1G9_9ASTR|nr:hypothetical protein E3N88_16596 [Mikania micrantha]
MVAVVPWYHRLNRLPSVSPTVSQLGDEGRTPNGTPTVEGSDYATPIAGHSGQPSAAQFNRQPVRSIID